MAGEENSEQPLSMNMFDISSLPTVEEVIENEETVVEEKTEGLEKAEVIDEKNQEPVKDKTDDQADDENQETVGTQEEKENVEEDAEKKASEKDTETPADSDDKVFKTLGNYLMEQGILTSLEGEIESEQDFNTALEEEIKSREFAGLNDNQKFYLEELAKGIPDELVAAKMQSGEVYKNITDDVIKENEDVRKQLIIQDLLAQDWTMERAEKQYQRLDDLGESVEEAIISRKNLVTRDEKAYSDEVSKIEQEKVDNDQAAAKRLEDLKKSVYDQEKVFGNFNVTKGLKEKVHNAMTKVVGYDENGIPLNGLMQARMENQVEFETNLYYLWELTNGFKDLGKLMTKVTSSASKKIREAVSGSTRFQTTQKPLENDSKEYIAPIVDIE